MYTHICVCVFVDLPPFKMEAEEMFYEIAVEILRFAIPVV